MRMILNLAFKKNGESDLNKLCPYKTERSARECSKKNIHKKTYANVIYDQEIKDSSNNYYNYFDGVKKFQSSYQYALSLNDSSVAKVIYSCLPKHFRTKIYLESVFLVYMKKINPFLINLISNQYDKLTEVLLKVKKNKIQKEFFKNSFTKKSQIIIAKFTLDCLSVLLLRNFLLNKIIMTAYNNPKYLLEQFSNLNVSHVILILQKNSEI